MAAACGWQHASFTVRKMQRQQSKLKQYPCTETIGGGGGKLNWCSSFRAVSIVLTARAVHRTSVSSAVLPSPFLRPSATLSWACTHSFGLQHPPPLPFLCPDSHPPLHSGFQPSLPCHTLLPERKPSYPVSTEWTKDVFNLQHGMSFLSPPRCPAAWATQQASSPALPILPILLACLLALLSVPELSVWRFGLALFPATSSLTWWYLET